MLGFPFNQAPATAGPARRRGGRPPAPGGPPRRGAGRRGPKANTVISGCCREANDGLAVLPSPRGGYLVPVLSRVTPLSARGPSGATGRTRTKEQPASGPRPLGTPVPFLC